MSPASHTRHGACRISCPANITSQWFMFHFPCCGSTHEKLALIDAYQALHYMRLVP